MSEKLFQQTLFIVDIQHFTNKLQVFQSSKGNNNSVSSSFFFSLSITFILETLTPNNLIPSKEIFICLISFLTSGSN